TLRPSPRLQPPSRARPAIVDRHMGRHWASSSHSACHHRKRQKLPTCVIFRSRVSVRGQRSEHGQIADRGRATRELETVMRADRLLSMLLLLDRHRRLTAADLAEQLEVSARTVYRDLDALSAAGVPVFAERGRGGACCLPSGYRVRLNGLSAGEAQALS